MIALVSLAGLSCPAREPAEKGQHPSILLVTIDTLRADHVGCYGANLAETPNLDRLARAGVRFEDARSHVPLTAPSHATLLTGLLPPRHGVRGNGLFRLEASATTLAEALRAKGYTCAAVVSSVVLDRHGGLDRGFQSYDDNQRVGDKQAFNYLERGASQVADAARIQLAGLTPPFFLWVHLYDPHVPWVAPAPFRERHAGRPYDAEIAFADAAFGEVWRWADARASGQLVVAATSDHGESLGEHGENQHGYTLHRGVLRVPLLLAGPGLPPGVAVAETIGLADLAPTIAELGGTSLGAVDGKSLGRFWSREAPPSSPGEALWEETLHPLYDSGWAPLRGLLTQRFHFVEAPRPELYERASDPQDRTDIAAERPEIVHELRAQLASLFTALGDVDEPPIHEAGSPEEREHLARLAALGYAGTGSIPSSRARRLDPKDALPGFIAVEEGEKLIELGRAKEARDRVEPYTRADPGNPRPWHALGKALLLLEDLERAERALERAIALDPQSEFIRYTYAAILRSKGDEPRARAELEGILHANARAVEASFELASMAVERGDVAGAEAILKASYDAGVRDPDLLDRLGRHLVQRGAKDEAARLFAEALALRPDDAIARLELGRAALRANDAGEAIGHLTRCTEGAQAFECRIELARAYVVGPRDLASARVQLLAARELAPDERMRWEVDRRLTALEGMAR